MKFAIVLFDKNCEPYHTGAYLFFSDNDSVEVAFDDKVVAKLKKELTNNGELNNIATGLGYSWDAWDHRDFSIQHDTRNNTIHLRDQMDCVGEPGNILMMVDLVYVED